MQFLENQENDNYDFERWGVLILFIIAVLGISYCMLKSTPYNMNKTSLEDNIKAEYQGRIVEKGLDSTNRNTPYYSFKDSKKIHEDTYVLDKVSVGDSIVKRANSSKIEIHKKDTIILVDYNDVYLHNDSLIKKRGGT